MAKIKIVYKNGQSYTLRGDFDYSKYDDVVSVYSNIHKDDFIERKQTHIRKENLACIIVSEGSHDKRLITFGKNNPIKTSEEIHSFADGDISCVSLSSHIPMDT